MVGALEGLNRSDNAKATCVIPCSFPSVPRPLTVGNNNLACRLKSTKTITGTLRATRVPYDEDDQLYEEAVDTLNEYAWSYPVGAELRVRGVLRSRRGSTVLGQNGFRLAGNLDGKSYCVYYKIIVNPAFANVFGRVVHGRLGRDNDGNVYLRTAWGTCWRNILSSTLWLRCGVAVAVIFIVTPEPRLALFIFYLLLRDSLSTRPLNLCTTPLSRDLSAREGTRSRLAGLFVAVGFPPSRVKNARDNCPSRQVGLENMPRL